MSIDGIITMPTHVHITCVRCFVYILKLFSSHSFVELEVRSGFRWFHGGVISFVDIAFKNIILIAVAFS